MSPVASFSLKTFYNHAAEDLASRKTLRSFFGCLAGALTYLHDIKIRHRDIKPENILVKEKNVYLADFGISLDWESLSRSTTTADSGRTPMYCAPEVIAPDQKRNSSSDVWSLGCVFLEMCTILKDQKIETLRAHFKQRSGSPKFHQNLAAIKEWSTNLRAYGSELDNNPLEWIAQMLVYDIEERTPMKHLYTTISSTRTANENESVFCADCCVLDIGDGSSGDSESDGDLWREDLDEELTSPLVREHMASRELSNHRSDSDNGVNPPDQNVSRSLQYRRTPDSVFSRTDTNAEHAFDTGIQHQGPWPAIDFGPAGFSGKLPKLSPSDWTTPSRLLLSVKEDNDFMGFLHDGHSRAYDLIKNANVADLTRLIKLLIENGLKLNPPAGQGSQIYPPIYCVLLWKSPAFQPLFSLMAQAGAKVDVAPYISHKPRRSLILQAVTQGSVWALEVIEGVDPHQGLPDWDNAVFDAALQGHLDVVEYLLGHLRLNPDPGWDGSVLNIACRARHAHVVEYLLKSHSGRINIAGRGRSVAHTSLFWACSQGHSEIVKLLIDFGADPHHSHLATSRTWCTPLEVTSEEGHTLTVQHIVNNQTSPLNQNTYGKALFHVCHNEKTEVTPLLLTHGVDPSWSQYT